MSLLLILTSVAVPVIAPVRVEHAPAIDGRLDDAVWTNVPASDSFTQSFPNDGADASAPTRIRVAYDDRAVYIAVECEQNVESIARLTRRDREVADDRVSIDIDTTGDRRSAFHFQVSAAGVLLDGLRYGDTELSTDWDDVWQANVARTANSWSAEIEIPFRILRLRSDAKTWGFQVRRWTGKTGEIDEWAYAPRDSGGEVSRYGELGPFDGLHPRGSIALVPFALTRLVRTDAAVPSTYGDGVSATAGLDLIWRPSANVTVAGAILPDFAQVEADQVVVNLTTTETEYPEKRPFFLQGMDLFQTPIQLLYTRRIGDSVASPVLPDGTTLVRPVGSAPILGAAKVLASVGGLNVAALSAVTDSVEAVTDAGATPAAPLASEHVARVRLSRERVEIGALATARKMGDATYPMVADGVLCPTGDVVTAGARCSHDAYTGGVDTAWRSEGGDWKAIAQLAGTRIEGGPPQMRPDGTIISSGDSGAGGIVEVAKEGGNLRMDLAYEAYSRRFDIDDIGYQPRANLQHGWADFEAYTAKQFGPFIEARTRVELFFRRTLDGLPGSSGYQWNVSGTTKDMWQGFLELHWRPALMDDREFGDGRALQRAGRLGIEASLRSDTRRAVVVGVEAYAASTHTGGTANASVEIEIHPRDNIELSLVPEFLYASGEPRFVDEDTMGPRFARQEARSFGITTRGTWTLTRDLTLQAYVQALLATIRFEDALTTDPVRRVIGLDDLQPASFDPAMYDGREGALNATIVARWEYRPGSTAFLVYSHAQSPAQEAATYEPRALLHGPASDAVLLKLSWAWLR